MLLLYLKNGKCKISIIVPVFIAEEIFLGCHLGWQRKQMLSVYEMVTAKNIFLQR